MTNIAIENGPVEIVDFPIKNRDFPIKNSDFPKKGTPPQPSPGLLLADRLLSAGCNVHLVEARNDPRRGSLEGRAYALGLGIRAQRAIRSGIRASHILYKVGPPSYKLAYKPH